MGISVLDLFLKQKDRHTGIRRLDNFLSYWDLDTRIHASVFLKNNGRVDHGMDRGQGVATSSSSKLLFSKIVLDLIPQFGNKAYHLLEFGAQKGSTLLVV